MAGNVSVCPAQITAFAGDDWLYTFTLFEDGAFVNLTGATITASVRSLTDQLAIAATAQSSSTTGAAWATGVVAIAFPNTATVALTKMEYFIELDVLLSGRYHTWPLIPVEVTRATITH